MDGHMQLVDVSIPQVPHRESLMQSGQCFSSSPQNMFGHCHPCVCCRSCNFKAGKERLEKVAMPQVQSKGAETAWCLQLVVLIILRVWTLLGAYITPSVSLSSSSTRIQVTRCPALHMKVGILTTPWPRIMSPVCSARFSTLSSEAQTLPDGQKDKITALQRCPEQVFICLVCGL